jgi:hypothetical protein
LSQAKTLSLSAQQTRALDSLAKAYEDRAKSLGKGLDTLDGIIDRARRDLASDQDRAYAKQRRDRPETKRDSLAQARDDSVDLAHADEHRKRGMDARNAVGEALLQARADFDAAVTAVNAVLANDQRSKIAPEFARASDELTQRLRWEDSR